MPDLLTDTSLPALARAVTANLQALNRHMRHSPVVEVYETPHFFRWRSPVPHPYFSGVICSAPPDATAPARARSTVEYFKSKGVSAFTWWFEPGLRAETWSAVLVPHGFVLDRDLPGMAVLLEGLARPGIDDAPEERHGPRVEIQRVEESARLRTWTETFVVGYELPPFWAAPIFELYDSLREAGFPPRCYLAYRDGEPVGTSTMFFGAGVAGIYDVATVPSARGQGIGAAMTRVPLLEARAEGYRVGVLQSSAMGLRVYERIGFRTVCRLEHFAWKAP
jgi:GNAT superfamily N-acetyltransferase